VDGSIVMRVHGATNGFSEENAVRAVHFGTERTFEQDPKYSVRILVDIAIRALSPAVTTQRERCRELIKSRTCCAD